MKTATRTSTFFATSITLLLFATGCDDSTNDNETVAEDLTASQQTVLEEFDLDGKTAAEIVDYLDRLGFDERPSELYASVRPDHLLLATEEVDEFTLDLSDEGFYLSFAPYIDQTHDCFFHSLTTCVGELGDEEIDVLITDSDGEIIVEETTTLFENGFVGYWLEPGIEGTLEVAYGDYAGSVPFATGLEDATCLTVLQLSD